MTDREKIINIVEQNKLCIVDVDCKDCQYKDKLDKTFTCGSYKLADLLIAANIGDVTEWKEQVECAKRILQIPTLPDGKTDLSYFEYKGERIQDIARQRDEYRHRAEAGELIDRDEYLDRLMAAKDISGMTDKELEFFAKHNARVRENAEVQVCKEVVKECLQVLRDTHVVPMCDDYARGWNKSIDVAIKRLAEKYCIEEEVDK